MWNVVGKSRDSRDEQLLLAEAIASLLVEQCRDSGKVFGRS